MTCKILMMIPVWRRPEILKLFVRNLTRVIPDYCEVIPFFILSQTDPELRQNEQATEGYMSTFADNKPLGEKKNTGLSQALELDWDYYMDMGSDDIFTCRLWELLEDCIECREVYFGLRNLHVFEIYSGRAKYVPGYHINKLDKVAPIGPGRCIRRDVVENFFPLWPAINQGLDSSSDLKLQEAGIEPVLIDSDEAVMCDVKTNVHLWPYEFFDDMGEDISGEWVREAFDIKQDYKAPFDAFHTSVLKQSNLPRSEGFKRCNEWHEITTGAPRYSSYGSYRVQVTRKNKK